MMVPAASVYMYDGAVGEAPDVAGELEPLLTRLTYLLRQAVLPPGMSRAQGRVLGTLRDSGPQRITVLADLERVTQPTMSGLVAGLERRGCVERCADGADRRVVLVRLTEEGRKVLARYTRAAPRSCRPGWPCWARKTGRRLRGPCPRSGS